MGLFERLDKWNKRIESHVGGEGPAEIFFIPADATEPSAYELTDEELKEMLDESDELLALEEARGEVAAGPGDRDVIPLENETWGVVEPDCTQLLSEHETQPDAIVRAEEMVRQIGGSLVRVYGEDGYFQTAHAVEPGT